MMDFEKELIIMIFGRKRDVCGLKKGGVINVIVCIESDVLNLKTRLHVLCGIKYFTTHL